MVECIDDVEQLEILLLLRRSSDRYFSAETIAKEQLIDPSSVAAGLERLAARNLLDVRIESSILYRFAPVDAERVSAINELSEVYSTHRLAVMRLLENNPRGAASTFADAFLFKGSRRKPPKG